MVFVKDLNSVMACILGKLIGNIKLGEVADMLKDKAAIQRDLNEWQEIWQNLMKFNKKKCQVLTWDGKPPLQQYGLGTDQLESSFLKKDLWVIVDKLNMSQQCALAAEKSKNLLCSINKRDRKSVV